MPGKRWVTAIAGIGVAFMLALGWLASRNIVAEKLPTNEQRVLIALHRALQNYGVMHRSLPFSVDGESASLDLLRPWFIDDSINRDSRGTVSDSIGIDDVTKQLRAGKLRYLFQDDFEDSQDRILVALHESTRDVVYYLTLRGGDRWIVGSRDMARIVLGSWCDNDFLFASRASFSVWPPRMIREEVVKRGRCNVTRSYQWKPGEHGRAQQLVREEIVGENVRAEINYIYGRDGRIDRMHMSHNDTESYYLICTDEFGRIEESIPYHSEYSPLRGE